jgi:outer membrane protein
MQKSRRGRAAAATLLSAAVSCGLVGCVESSYPFDPRDAQRIERRDDSELHARPLPNLPTTEESDYNPDASETRPAHANNLLNIDEGPPVRMSLQQIIHRAVANNLDIRVAAYDTAIDQTRIIEAEGAFDPHAFSDYSFQRVDKVTAGTEVSIPNTSFPYTNNVSQGFPGTSLQVSRTDLETVQTFDVGIRQNLSSGGNVEVKQTIANNWFRPARTLMNPFYEDDLTLTLNQPLLQNFGTDVNRARITIAVNNQRVSLLDFRKTVEDTVLKLEQDYWELVEADQDIETIKKLIAASEETTRILKARKDADASAAQVLQAEAETSNRQAQLIQQKDRAYTLSDEIKKLMNDPRYPVSGAGVITPTDEPTEVPIRFNLDDQIETGMNNRLELGQQQVRIESAQIAHRVAKNGLLPTLNLQLQAAVDGVGHSLESSIDREGEFNHIGGTAGLQFEFAIGNRAARAVFERAELQEIQAILSYGKIVKDVVQDVKGAAREVDSAWARVVAYRASRLQYAGLLDKLQKQIDAGAPDSFTFDQIFIRLQDQQQLAAAEQAEHQALNDYNYAIANLEKAKGTILRYNNVIMEQDSRPTDLINQYGGTHGRPFELLPRDQ